MINQAQERLHRLLQIINLGGHVREDVLREAERSVARLQMNRYDLAA